MECDLPSVKHKNFLIRIVRNLSNYFNILANKLFVVYKFLKKKQLLLSTNNIQQI